MHARRIRSQPQTGPIDRRRLAAAGLSALIPGLGQAFNRRRRLALLFLVPTAILFALVLMAFQLQSTPRLLAWAITPAVLGTLLTLNILILGLRLTSMGQAFLDTRRPGPTGRLGIIGIVVIAVLVVTPHLLAWRYGTLLQDTFATVFRGEVLAAEGGPKVPKRPAPKEGERINVLLIGIDALPWRTAILTDTMMVASLDPVGKSVSLLSLPRDLINVPLDDEDVFGPKLNSLMSYADHHPEDFPQGGISALEDAVGELLDIPIHYYARVDFIGFIDMVDAVGGVDVTVAKGFDDPGIHYGLKDGFSIAAGRHHLDGLHALAYARARKAAGESDFSRAARQQQIIVALRDGVTSGGSLLWEIPALLDAVGRTVNTDVPPQQLPTLAAILDEVEGDAMGRAIIRHPLVRSEDTRYGSSLVPDVAAIQAMAADLFSEPGTPPTSWPSPEPSAAP